MGYTGNDCNTCDVGFYETNNTYEEKTCTGEQNFYLKMAILKAIKSGRHIKRYFWILDRKPQENSKLL